jgi:membrane-bound serine protease (ClpP class)
MGTVRFIKLSKRRLKFWLLLTVILLLAASAFGLAEAQGNQVLVAEIKGPVTPAMASYFDRLIKEAEETNSEAALIVLNTPGGGVDVTLEIVQSFRNANVPVIVYISPSGAQAASAGSIIVAAAHAAGMAPETVIGAASPVDGSGADIGEVLFQKITEDLKATMRNLTERRGEEAVALAEAMIEEAKAVTSKEALEAQFIDVVADDVDDLLEQLDGQTVEIDGQEITLETAGASQEPFDQNTVEQLLHALSNPLLIGILLTIGVQAILIEISSPGGWAAGFIGVLCLGMALYGLGTLPANWLGLGLIVIAFILFLLEVKTATFGLLAVAGVITFLVGLLVLFNSPGTPDFARISITSAIGITIFTAAFFIFLVTKAVQAQRRQPLTGTEGLVGMVGPVRTDLIVTGTDPKLTEGTVLVNGEIWRAISDEEIGSGEQVVVKSVDGFTLRVKKISP